jgi:hypothetical protein
MQSKEKAMRSMIDMAREAGFVEYELEDYTPSGYDVRYERLVALTRADEREACAQMCELWDASHPYAIAAAIRARGNT